MRLFALLTGLLIPLEAFALCSIEDDCLCGQEPNWIAVVRGESTDGGDAAPVVEALYQRNSTDAGPTLDDLSLMARAPSGFRWLLTPDGVLTMGGQRGLPIGTNGTIRCQNASSMPSSGEERWSAGPAHRFSWMPNLSEPRRAATLRVAAATRPALRRRWLQPCSGFSSADAAAQLWTIEPD
jgi:hypothetical protein